VQAYLNLDANRAVCDDITVVAPTTEAIDVDVEITEYDPAFTEAFLTAQINSAL
jgi:hypothetical protein